MRASVTRWSSCLLEVILVLVVGFVVCQLIRLHLCECYRIPSPSMEPTLHGGVKRRGDLVLVNKTSWWGQLPEPFDLVVFRSLISGKDHIVKRVAAIGPCELRLKNGDLWISDEKGQLQRVRKDPLAHRDLRVDLFRHLGEQPCLQPLEQFVKMPPTGSVIHNDGIIDLQAARPGVAQILTDLKSKLQQAEDTHMVIFVPGFMATFKGLDDSFLSPVGKRLWQGKNYRADIGLEMQVTATPGVEALVFVHEYHDHDLAVIWERSGDVRLVKDGEDRGVKANHPFGNQSMRLSFGYLDGRLFLTRDEETVLLYAIDMGVENQNQTARRINGLQFGVCGRTGVSIQRVTVFRDLSSAAIMGGSVWGEGGTYTVHDGDMFLLGDNSHDSTDSRTTMGTVSLDRLVGRPIGILEPSRRARLFVR